MERDFKGIWIPKEIWLDENLNWTEKLLLVEIDSLAGLEQGCFASNEYFSKFFGLSKDRISKLVSSLKNKGYIEVELIYKPNTKQIEKRIISTLGYRQKQLEGIVKNNHRGIGENAEDNNTIYNNTNNNNNNIVVPVEVKKEELTKEQIEFRNKLMKFKDEMNFKLREKNLNIKIEDLLKYSGGDMELIKKQFEYFADKGASYLVASIKNKYEIPKPVEKKENKISVVGMV